MSSQDPSALLARVRLEKIRQQKERLKAESHPAYLLDRMEAFDERAAEPFAFHATDPESGWYWQRDVLDWWLGNQRTIALKARQLGVTWLGCAFVLWTMLYKRGSLCLAYRQKEEEAFEVVGRVWDLLQSLPKHLWNGAEVVKPDRGARPSGEIRLRFPDGRVSRLIGMTSASASGHGKTAAVVLMDEFSRIDRAAEIMKAVQPAAGSKGKIIIISTANGMSDPEGNGNYFHYLWTNAEEMGFAPKFLSWRLHPDRDDNWYQNDPEVKGLLPHERAEQYPANPHEAFLQTGRPFFDEEAIAWYAERVPKPLYRFDFQIDESVVGSQKAKVRKSDTGLIRVYKEPVAERENGGDTLPAHSYAVGADVATGRGKDYSCAYVVDLSNMEIAAEFHGKIDPDLFAAQLHFLGRWYRNALIAPETQGGYGEAVIIPLRDGRAGRPAYPKLYRHVLSNRPDLPLTRTFGFPMNQKTRPLAISQLEQAIRERTLPWMTDRLLSECRTFVHRTQLPSPAANHGCNDDAVMAASIALELYRQRGEHPKRVVRKPSKPKLSYPWQGRKAA